MMKSLAIALALAIPATASADTRVYDVHATRVADPDDRFMSCDAADRMLKDKHVIKIDDDGNVYVNGFKWKALTEEPDLVLSFHNSEGRTTQKTFLVMDLYVNQRGLSGKYTLFGRIPDVDDPRKQYVCADTVYVDGTAR